MRPALLLTALLIAGCAAPSDRVQKSTAVKPATADQVARCAYLDDVVGTSALYGVFAASAAENARLEALTKAEKLGATDVVWTPAAGGHGSTSVTGKAYRCSGPTENAD